MLGMVEEDKQHLIRTPALSGGGHPDGPDLFVIMQPAKVKSVAEWDCHLTCIARKLNGSGEKKDTACSTAERIIFLLHLISSSSSTTYTM
jgi:hypothetical protein